MRLLLVLALAGPAGAEPVRLGDSSVEATDIDVDANAAPAPRKPAPLPLPRAASAAMRSEEGGDASLRAATPRGDDARAAVRAAPRPAKLETWDAGGAAIVESPNDARPGSAAPPPQVLSPYGDGSSARAAGPAPRDSGLDLPSGQKTLIKQVIGYIKEFVYFPLTWLAAALVAIAVAVLSLLSRQPKGGPPSELPDAQPSKRALAMVRHRPRRRR